MDRQQHEMQDTDCEYKAKQGTQFVEWVEAIRKFVRSDYLGSREEDIRKTSDSKIATAEDQFGIGHERILLKTKAFVWFIALHVIMVKEKFMYLGGNDVDGPAHGRMHD